jgi:hypothetical protein
MEAHAVCANLGSGETSAIARALAPTTERVPRNLGCANATATVPTVSGQAPPALNANPAM